MGEEIKTPLLLNHSDSIKNDERTIWAESKKLWRIVGPAIFSRISSYSMFVITQAFAGHLGDTELAAVSIICNVIAGFNFGLLLGMASALETLCGQAFGAKQYHMLGVYLQRAWIVLLGICILLMPTYMFSSRIFKLLGQPAEVAEVAGTVALYLIPMHFSFAFLLPLIRFLQSQLKNVVSAWAALVAMVVHVAISWLFVYGFKLGVVGTAVTLSISWCVYVVVMLIYTVCGGCPLTWSGFSMEAFSDLWKFFKLSISSGVMLCLESWYYKILIVMTGNMKNVEIAVDALSICMTINTLELMIPFGFFAGIGVRVANELGAGNGMGAKFATLVAVTTSATLGFFFMLLILFFHGEIGLIFSTSKPVLDAVSSLSILLAFTILLNSVQPVLSGVAVGSGWQARVAYINIACYYIVGLPLGFLMQLVFHKGIMGVWAGMIFGGTALQTLILVILTLRCDWEKEAAKASKRVKEYCGNLNEK